MHAVINQLHFKRPVQETLQDVEGNLGPIIEQLPGFKSFYVVQTAEDRATVIILWETEADAINGGKTIGPTYFATAIAPHLASDQVRELGPVIVTLRR